MLVPHVTHAPCEVRTHRGEMIEWSRALKSATLTIRPRGPPWAWSVLLRDTTWRRRVSDRIMTSQLLVRFSVSKPGSPRFARRAAFSFVFLGWINLVIVIISVTVKYLVSQNVLVNDKQKNRILITAKLYPTRCRQSHILYFAGKIFYDQIFRFLKPLPHRSDYFKRNWTFLLIF